MVKEEGAARCGCRRKFQDRNGQGRSGGSKGRRRRRRRSVSGQLKGPRSAFCVERTQASGCSGCPWRVTGPMRDMSCLSHFPTPAPMVPSFACLVSLFTDQRRATGPCGRLSPSSLYPLRSLLLLLAAAVAADEGGFLHVVTGRRASCASSSSSSTRPAPRRARLSLGPRSAGHWSGLRSNSPQVHRHRMSDGSVVTPAQLGATARQWLDPDGRRSPAPCQLKRQPSLRSAPRPINAIAGRSSVA